MDVVQLIKNRRSIRNYKSDPISEKDLLEILESGMAAPSAVNLQPWYFVVIRDEEKMKTLAKIMAKVSSKMEPSLRDRFPNHPEVVEESARFIKRLGGAPVCILAFQYEANYNKTASSIIQSVSAAIENMLLAAWSKGIGSCWLTAPLEVEAGEELRKYFAPEKGELVAMITMGYPEHKPQAPRQKNGRYIIL